MTSPTKLAPGSEPTAALRTSPERRLIGEVAETRAQATKAAKTSSQILAILENGDASEPTALLDRLVTGLAEQHTLLQRMDRRLDRIEMRLGLSG